jgi:pyruvate,orthophosphate dikinase
MAWADEVRTIKIRANADTPRDANQAIQFGAEGIGLCRTEHMFFADDRIPIVQKMILADTPEGRQAALNQLLPMQRKDFKEIFNVMHGLPVTIRTLDPPLHEFLPRKHEVQDKLAKLDPKSDDYEEEQIRLRTIIRRIEELSEMNPMLGHRGCRLGIVFPEITEMQVRAIIEAACDLTKDKKPVQPEIMIPLVGHVNELKNQKAIVERIALEVTTKTKVKDALKYSIGTMIEIPRAALTADEIAQEAEFFSFGTNDLTQMGMGFSRDDAGKFLSYYVENGILPKDPFVTIDREGVGQLVRMGTEKGRAARPGLKVGVCGEHGGDPESIGFFNEVGLDYVSCSPYRVPIARLAAAQVVLRSGEERKGKKGK